VFYSFLSKDSQWRKNNIVHELGHLFNGIHGGWPMSFAGNYAAERADLLRPVEGSTVWQMHPVFDPTSPGLTNSEMFADMFVAWIYDAWNSNPVYLDSIRNVIIQMNIKMTDWIN
jgi:hypothetical protein